MHAEIISIGDELTSGQRLDTNSQWLSQRLSDLGIQPLYHTTVGDQLQANIEVFRIAARRAHVVIATGGLGPTADDLTRQAIAQAFQRPLQENARAMEHIQRLFARRKRPMPERNRVQALFPEGSRVVDNPHGTAPGIDLLVEHERFRSQIIALPGVPAEMIQMWNETVQPRLIDEWGLANRWYFHSIKVFGIGESDVEAKLPDLIVRDRIPRVGITVSQATITLRIATQATSLPSARAQMEATEQEIHQAFGDLVFGYDKDELEDAVLRLLQRSGQSLATLEVGPDARLIPWLNRADQILPARILGGISFRSTQALRDWMVRQKQTVSETGSELVPEAAAAVARQFQSDWCLAIGVYPEHSEVASAQSIPTAGLHVVVIGPQGIYQRFFELGGHPEVLYPRLAKTGLDQLRRLLVANHDPAAEAKALHAN
jgi:nicotinamide-nucleotide amidase